MRWIGNCSLDELYLITPEYLEPYLSYVQKYKCVFMTAIMKQMYFAWMIVIIKCFRHVFTPILDRYGVPLEDRKYLMSFYIQGMMAIITEWLKNDCKDSVEHIMTIIQRCVMQPHDNHQNKE